MAFVSVICTYGVLHTSASTIEVLQFRIPYSLNEIIRDNLGVVQDYIHDASQSTASDITSLLQVSLTTIDSVSNQFDMLIGKSNTNVVHRDDLDFLQNLIDRIDSMIQTLETTRSVTVTEQGLIQQNIQALHILKSKL